MKKLIFILIDGLNYDSKSYLGYLESLVENNLATEFKVQGGLPSLSKPIYELLLTGIQPVSSGITNNMIRRLSKEESIFSLAKKHNLKTGAAAYYWISELYNDKEFNPALHQETEDENKNISYGRFYWEDDFPDSHLFNQGEILRRKYNLDFLLIHSMNVDDMGHKFGSKSKEYRDSIRKVSSILANYLPTWMSEGYEVIITSDHGMSEDGNHGGDFKLEREVPLWLISQKIINKKTLIQDKLPQNLIAPLCCDILEIKKSIKMEKVSYD